MESQQNSCDVKFWLQSALINEELTDFSVDILGNSEKGDGYLGDVVFVAVKGKTRDNKSKSYDLVLKCSKKSQALRDSVPIKETFENEIYVYSDIFPTFKQFQIDKGIENVFDSVPKYYGKFTSENMEVLVLQNLKEIGYSLYDRTKPLTFDHIKLLVREYAKFHAISAAMQLQHPEKFKQLVDGMQDVWRKYEDCMDVNKLYCTPIDEIFNLFQKDLTDAYSQKLKDLRKQVGYIVHELAHDQTHFSVITHGDNWNNNYMFKYEDTDPSKPKKVVMLDWQIARLMNPVTDLSYLLYACISREDLKKFDDILMEYHRSFSSHLKQLGSDPDKVYPFSDFLADWKVFGKYGVVMALLIIKVVLSDQNEVGDITETVESGQDLSNTFAYEIKDTEKLKDRVFWIIEHAIEHDII